jgi:hypothetical protein
MKMPLAKYIDSNVDALAAEVTQRMETERPELFQRYRNRSTGEARDPAEWCKEDTAYHLRHLAAALDTEDREEFQEYRSWLVQLLAVRGIPEEDIDANFEAIAEALTERLGDEASPAISLLAIH